MLKIKADTMGGALAEARRLLGENALVLHTKQCEEPQLFGLKKKQAVEILAASQEDDNKYASQTSIGLEEGHGNEALSLDSMGHQVEEIRKTLAELVSGLVIARNRERLPSVERLMKNGVSESLAEMLLSGCSERPEQIMEVITKRMRCTGTPNSFTGQQRIALVGPTGVGKTTTAAKIAAQYSIFQKKSVALITLDTYRIGAVEQLASYARILDIPMEVALSPEDGEALVRKHADKDLIVIDTVGRSQRNRGHIMELGVFLKAAHPTQVHLVLSGSADLMSSREAIDSFGVLRTDRLILTKLDECSQSGCVLELAAGSLLPFSYITNGQNVPDDIAIAESKMLASFVWEGSL